MGLRSEKEIKEKIKKDLTGKLTESGDIQRMVLDWVLEGEPRYSVAELEKIIESDAFTAFSMKEAADYCSTEPRLVTKFLKDPKKVEEIL